jgi:hypothetical protein
MEVSMPKDKVFFKSRECDGFAVWSLHNPVDPKYGHWGWAHINRQGRVEFIRQMTPAEIAYIRTRYMVWGDKLSNQSWAKVVGYEGGSAIGITVSDSDPTGGVGV